MIHECYLFKCEISGFLLIMSTLGLSQLSLTFLLLNSGTLFSYLIVKYMTADSWFLGNNPEREKIQKAIFYLDFVWMLLDILYESVWILECLCWQSCWKLAWSIGPLLVGKLNWEFCPICLAIQNLIFRPLIEPIRLFLEGNMSC